MTPKELASYDPFVMGEPGFTCFLCRQAIGIGDKCCWVPETCDDTERRDSGQSYSKIPAHQSCIEIVP